MGIVIARGMFTTAAGRVTTPATVALITAVSPGGCLARTITTRCCSVAPAAAVAEKEGHPIVGRFHRFGHDVGLGRLVFVFTLFLFLRVNICVIVYKILYSVYVHMQRVPEVDRNYLERGGGEGSNS